MLHEKTLCGDNQLNWIELYDDDDQIVFTASYNRNDDSSYDSASERVDLFILGYNAGRSFKADR
jgi:hypothetical protein